MKKGFFQWVFVSLGYLVYTLMVLVVLLWVLFPAESLRLWLQARLKILYPALEWEIEAVQTALPFSLQISGIRISEKNDARESSLIKISEIELTPPLSGLLSLNNHIPVMYKVKILDGTVLGRAGVDRQKGSLRCSGSLKDIQLGRLDGVWKKLNRPVSGKLSGNFEYMGIVRNLLQGDLQADLTITEGDIGFMQPVLGMESLEFAQAKTKVSMKEAIITVEQGEVESRLFAGSYSGTITFFESLATSGVDVQGFFEPRPELFGRMQDQTTISLIRNQLQDGKLLYTVNGSLLEPGILFKGTSGVIDGIIEGGMK